MTFDKSYVLLELKRRDDEHARLERENRDLKRRITELETELHRVKFAPSVHLHSRMPWKVTEREQP